MSEPMSRKRKMMIGAGVAAVVLVAAAVFGVWWFLKDDAPDAVNLADAVAVADGDAGSATDEGPAADAGDPAPTIDGVEGSWSVDTSIGSFTFEEATGSFVGFRVNEELTAIGSTTAVGRTGAVSGDLEISGSALTATSITADLSQLTTNESRRDSRARGALDTDSFPNATFVLTESVDLGSAVDDGSPVSVQAVGELTIKGVTQLVTFEIEAQLVGDTVAVIGSTEVVFADFGVTVPSAPVVVSAEDHGIIEFQLLFSKS